MWNHTNIRQPAHRQDTEDVASWVFDIQTQSMEYSDQLPGIYNLSIESVNPDTIVAAILERVLPEDRAKLQEAMARAIEAKDYTDLIFRVLRANGDLRYLRTVNGHLKDHRYLFGTTIDVTDRVESYVTNRQGAVLELAEKSLRIGFVVKDFVHHTQNFTDGVFRLLEIDPNIHPDEVWDTLLGMVPEEDQVWLKSLDTIFSVPGRQNERTIFFRLKGGDTRYIRIRFNTLQESNQRVIIFEDVSEEYLVQLELKRNRMFLKMGGAAANVGGYLKNNISGEMTVTDQVIRMFELESVNEIRPEHIMKRVHPEDMSIVTACYEKTLRCEPVAPIEYRIIIGDGDIRWIRHQVSYKNNGQLTSGTVLDITDEVTRRRSLEATNKEIEQLMYSVSHDLRAPVRHISSYAYLLQEEARKNLSDEHQEFLDNILQASGKLAGMLDKLLEFSKTRHQDLHKTWLNTADLVNGCVGLFKTQTLERQISWSVEELPGLFGHKELIERVFQNLISNAVKFTRKTSLPVIRIRGREDGNQTIITIQDNGAGFDMEYANKLFELFERLHSSEEFEGTGYGLASVHQIIRRHGGDIWAEGKPGEGASFHFSLPLH